MRSGSLGDAGPLHGLTHRPLDDLRAEVMPALDSAPRVDAPLRSREDPLPRPRDIRAVNQTVYALRFFYLHVMDRPDLVIRDPSPSLAGRKVP